MYMTAHINQPQIATVTPARRATPQSPGYSGLIRLLLVGLLLLLGLAAGAQANSLDASVDRDHISINDSLNLTLTGQVAVNFSGFSLFNFSLPSPDLAPLQKDWEVLGQSQKYNFQSINGHNQATVTWQLQLAPKSVGTLTIPALTYKDAQSQPITITVDKTANNASSPHQEKLFVEVETNKKSLYVQEQLLVTVRLYSQADQLTGDLSEPQPANAIVQQLGKEQDGPTLLNGKRYRLIQRQYAIFPQASGTLTIDPLTFKGNTLDGWGNSSYARASSDPITIEVLPPPADAKDKNWIPAMSLALTENWSRDPAQLQVGDSVTRTLTLKALGLEGSQLPPLPSQNFPQIKQYPQQPQISSDDQAAGVTGTRVEKIAIVAVQNGDINLPEIRVPWWDTVNNAWREAVIPARSIHIGGAASSNSGSTAATTPAPAVAPTPATPPATTAAPAATPVTSNTPGAAANDSHWKLISLALLLAWLLTLLIGWWLWRRRTTTAPTTSAPAGTRQRPDEVAFAALLAAADKPWPELRTQLLHWARAFWPERSIHAVADLHAAADYPVLSDAIRALEVSSYSQHRQQTVQTKTVIDAVRTLRDQRRALGHAKAAALDSLYPSQST